MNTALTPLILDFDGSVLPLCADERRIPLHDWQERIRFGCGLRQFEVLKTSLSLPPDLGCVFMGSGDYHHISALLLQHLAREGRQIEVVVCDNHPDNMLYPFGIHCGSWVYHASRLPFISHIHVVGITSADITFAHAWENHRRPLRNGRISYWSINRKAPWLNRYGADKAQHDFAHPDELIAKLVCHLRNAEHIYLSIDKDVFAKRVVETNWDQGCFELSHVQAIIAACRERLAGADVTGEISSYRYRSLFKRLLAGFDGLKLPDPARLLEWQEAHQRLNINLLSQLAPERQ